MQHISREVDLASMDQHILGCIIFKFNFTDDK